MTSLRSLKVKVFADGAEINAIRELSKLSYIAGFTTNPSLMRKAGVSHYERFAREAIELIGSKPISFEVFSDDFSEMEAQARKISRWGESVFAKIPITNSQGESSATLIRRLTDDGIKVNVTAVFTMQQVVAAFEALKNGAPANISVFAGRMADIGVDPIIYIQTAVALSAVSPNIEIIWASCREVYNIMQASDLGCHIITTSRDIIDKLKHFGSSLDELAIEAVRAFRRDSVQSGFFI